MRKKKKNMMMLRKTFLITKYQKYFSLKFAFHSLHIFNLINPISVKLVSMCMYVFLSLLLYRWFTSLYSHFPLDYRHGISIKDFSLPIFPLPSRKIYLRERFLPSWFSSTIGEGCLVGMSFKGRVRHNSTRLSRLSIFQEILNYARSEEKTRAFGEEFFISIYFLVCVDAAGAYLCESLSIC